MKSIKEIIQILSADEPDYLSIASKLTKEDYLKVNKLTRRASTAIATRAIICLGYVSENLPDGIVAAAKSDNPVLRLTAAQALSRMKGAGANQEVIKLINDLLDDKDIGVRKFALKTTAIVGISSLKGKIKQISENEPNDRIKKLAQDVFEQLKIIGDTPIL